MDICLYYIAAISILVRVQGGKNSFRSGDLAALDMMELKNLRIYDPLGQTRLVPTFQECVGMCLSLSYCLSFNAVKSKADEWLCHATRYNYTDVVSKKDLEVFNNSYIYAFNDRSNISKSSRGPSSCDELKNSSLHDASGVYLIDLQVALAFKADCKIKYILPVCMFQYGDGIGGTEVKQIGKYSNLEDCILKCSKQRIYNGVTISIGFGDECWCEKNMTGRNTHDLYMSCKFNGELQPYISESNSNAATSNQIENGSSCDQLKKSTLGRSSGLYLIHLNSDIKVYCLMELILPGCTFAIGDGIGGTEAMQPGIFSKPEDCIITCAQQGRFNGATISASTGTSCYCEENMTGRSGTKYKSCIFEGRLQANGWLEVARLNTTQHGYFLLEDAESNNITNLEQVTTGKFALSQLGLRALKKETNFTHIRFQCSKSSHNRIIDIATNKSDVINWLLGNTDVVQRPASCGSYYVLPGDSSLISKVCNQWGYTGNWGHATSNVPLLWTFVIYTHMQQHWLFDSRQETMYTAQYFCDDFSNAPGSSGVWRMFVK